MTDESSNDPIPMTPAHVSWELDGDVAVVTIDDGKANALSHQVLAGLEQALDEVEASAARAVAVIGRDGKFSAGFDLSIMTSGPAQARDLLGRGARAALRLYEFPIPVVFGVTGHALAMGGILLSAADVRVGAEGSFRIGLPEVRIGMPVPMFAVELCRDRVSPRWFTRSVHLAEALSPAQALDAGFLDEVVEPDRVRIRSLEVAAELAEAIHPGPFRLTRRNCRGDLIARLETILAEDLADFTVEPA